MGCCSGNVRKTVISPQKKVADLKNESKQEESPVKEEEQKETILTKSSKFISSMVKTFPKKTQTSKVDRKLYVGNLPSGITQS